MSTWRQELCEGAPQLTLKKNSSAFLPWTVCSHTEPQTTCENCKVNKLMSWPKLLELGTISNINRLPSPWGKASLLFVIQINWKMYLRSFVGVTETETARTYVLQRNKCLPFQDLSSLTAAETAGNSSASNWCWSCITRNRIVLTLHSNHSLCCLDPLEVYS